MGDVETLYTQKFATGIRMLQQQKPSRFQQAVMVETDIMERKAFDQLNPSEMSEKVGRNTDTPITEADHLRRWVYTRDWEKAHLFDKEDDIRVLNNPINRYSMNFVAAGNRKRDERIVAAFEAAAVTGKNGTTTATFPGSGFDVAHATTLLTEDKVRSAAQILSANENDSGESPWFFGINAKNLYEGLLAEQKVTSSDYVTVKALVDGKIDSWMGFQFLQHYESFPIAANIRTLYAWSKASMMLGIGANPFTRVEQRADKSYATQVYRSEHFDATRMDEKGVVRVYCDET